MTLPLDGVFVLDLSRVLAGPFASMRLADLGARILKIESPDGDPTRRFGPPFTEGESAYFMSLNRGKESVVLDLSSSAGREIVERLVQKADVLLENFKPGGLEKLGFPRRRLEELNPRLIHCRISGYGSRHPRADEPVFDLAIQAESGFMSMTGEADGPPVRAGVSLADLAAGGAAVEAIVAALYRREKTQKGAMIEVPLLDALTALFNYQAQSVFVTGKTPDRLGSGHPNLCPYQAFQTKDGWIVVAIAVDEHWRRFLAIDGMPVDLGKDAWKTNAGRVGERALVIAAVQDVIARRTNSEWIAALAAAAVPSGEVKTVARSLDEYRARGDDFVRTFPHSTLGEVPMIGSPILWNGERPTHTLGPPTLGEQTRDVLGEIAHSDEERERWIAAMTHSRNENQRS